MNILEDQSTQIDLEKTLQSGSFTVEHLLDATTFVDFAKSGSSQMIQFLTQPDKLTELISIALSGTDDEKSALRASRATDGISLNQTLTSSIIGKSDLVDQIFIKIMNEPPLIKIQASSACKLIVRFFRFKYSETIKSALKNDFIGSIEKHIGNDFVVHMVSELLDEYETDDHTLLMKYFAEHKLIHRLLHRFVTTNNSLEMSNISSIVLVSLERFSLSGMEIIMSQLMSPEVLRPIFDSSVNQNSSQQKEVLQLVYHLAVHAGVSNNVQFFSEMKTCIKPYNDILKNSNDQLQLGFIRLLISKIIVVLITSSKCALHSEIAENNVLSTLLDLFFSYNNNNLLHIIVAEGVRYILSNSGSELLKKQLINECQIIKRTKKFIQVTKTQNSHLSSLGNSLYFNEIFEEFSKTDPLVREAFEDALEVL